MHTMLRTTLLLLAAPWTANAFADGRIVVAHDDFTLTDGAFVAAPDAGQFALNVADWFTGGQPGNFLVWSDSAGLTGTQLSQTMTGAGHSWTVSTTGVLDLPTLLQYHAVFLGGYAGGVDTTALTQYVQAGGCVYVCAGAGFTMAAAVWNPFLFNFGLGYMPQYNSFTGVRPIGSSHPIFFSVSELYEYVGNSIVLGPVPNADAHLLVSVGVQGLYAVYDGDLNVSSYCTAKVNSLGCTPQIGWSGWPSASSSSPFLIRATNVVNNKQGLFFYGYSQQVAPFQGGYRCMSSPTRRTPTQDSSGASAPTNDCSGVYSIDFNGWLQSGVDPLLVVGQEVDGQFWSRDPQSPSTTGLTDAIRVVIGG